MKKRIVSFFLVISLIGALCVPAFAMNKSGEVGYDTDLDTSTALMWRDMMDNSPDWNMLSEFGSLIGGKYEWLSSIKTGYKPFDWLVGRLGVGEVTERTLNQRIMQYNSNFGLNWASLMDVDLRNSDAFQRIKSEYSNAGKALVYRTLFPNSYNTHGGTPIRQSNPKVISKYDAGRGVYRPYDENAQMWITDSYGRFVCYKPEDTTPTQSYDDQWIQSSTLDNQLNSGEASLHMTSKAALEALASQLGSGVRVQHWHEYYVIANMAAGNSRSVPIRCDYAGFPYACWYDENTAAVNTPRTTTDIENVDGADDLTQTNDSTEINYNGMTIVLPDGDFNIGEINYNSNNKTYNIEAYKYDITNNYYYTYNYSWTYHINYTSITYIGQSEEYDRTYNLYYQLPDGRSSADLTAEELEQLNLAVDVINYGRSADDTRLRSLYHFDGNTDDASYWNYCTAFTWNQGASLTYLESGNFNGALYLDETDHDFTLTLPSALGSNDFTLQFRYYQSATAAPQNDSYIRFGSTDLMRFNGSQILNGSGTVLSTMPIGTWNELAIIRESGTVRYYLNGVQLGTASNSTAFTAAVTFHFGSSQQTYKELDELRVLNYALTEGDANYTPTSVPHDTNLALVLPDSVVPVADEYWDIHVGGTNLLSQYNLDYWDSGHLDSLLSSSYYNVCSPRYGGSYTGAWFPSVNVIGTPVTSSGYSIGSSDSPYATVSLPYTDRYGYTSYDYYSSSTRIGSLSFAIKRSGHYPGYSYLTATSCVFSIVFADGSVSSFQFNPNTSISSSSPIILGTTHGYTLEFGCRVQEYDGSLFYTTYLTVYGDSSASEFVYLCLEEGTESTVTAEFVSSVTLMDSSSLNTPTLAVRSDIPVTNYQIGGVRPSIPYKGLVWAMVESGYISSLQIYDGRAWVQCDGRIWTGERWIPYSSYNVVTLSDMYDIADASGQSGYEYIYSESGFWSWFQKAWLDFRQWTSTMLSTVQGLGSGGGSSGGSVVNDLDVDPDSEEESSVWLVGFIKRIAKLGGRAVRGVSDIVIEDALSNAADGLGDLTSFYSADASEPDGYVTTFSLDGSDGNLHGFAVYDASEVWQ